MSDIFDVPEGMPFFDIQQEETFGIVHKIFFTKENSSYVVNVQFAMEGKEAPNIKTVQYKKIFTDGRFFFQMFCKSFDTITDDGSIDLSKALGKLCVSSYNPEYENFVLEYVPDSEAPELRKYFRKLIIPEMTEDVPSMIANYWYMPKYDGKKMFQANMLGFITGYSIEPDIWDNENDTICFHVVAMNGTSPIKTRFYLNRIYGEGSDYYQHFCNKFDIPDETNNPCFNEILFIPCMISLKRLKGNLYARSINPVEFENKYQEKQAKLLISWYKKEMQKAEKNKPRMMKSLRGIIHV